MRLTTDRLREVLDYDPATGIFRWRAPPKHRAGVISAGDVAGHLGHKGFWFITVDCKQYRAHHLAWLHVHGIFPTTIIDHRDRNRRHNAIDNLRPATNGQNRANSRPNKNGCGLKGARLIKGRWYGYIKAGGVDRYLGAFPTKEAAHEAYKAAATRLHGEFANW